MLAHIQLEHILFLDIETVPEARSFQDLPLRTQELWAKKTELRRQDKHTPEEFYSQAGIFAEFE